jgi:HSP20 family molecular chaperone IbpA
MEVQARASPSFRGRRVIVRVANSNEREKRIRDAIAARAFELFKTHASIQGSELDDWRRAEAEILIPPCHGLTARDGRLIATTNVSCFTEGEIEVLVEPRRLTVCGRAGNPQTCHARLGRPVFRVIALPAEIDPAKVTARFDHGMLEISLPKAGVGRVALVASQAA